MRQPIKWSTQEDYLGILILTFEMTAILSQIMRKWYLNVYQLAHPV